MKLPVSWLREWVDIPWEAAELARRLTMAGFEIESVAPAAPPFSGVVVARIVSAERHPQADKLQVCQVDAGQGAPLQIVCGAANARAGLRVALAQVGAVLPGDLKIKAAKLRGVESAGMLCSARELGLAEASSGLLELADDAPIGADLRQALDLDDTVLEINVTPNRGDAMSVLGIAREIAALAGSELHAPAIASVAPQTREAVTITLQPDAGAGRLLGRVFSHVDNSGSSPSWLAERLRRAGLRPISPVVDITNYVLIELGQPMHAYDVAKLAQPPRIEARSARPGESLTLLNGATVEPASDVLVIADAREPVSLAGIMGGERTQVTPDTGTVFLEVAWFDPDAIAGRARRYGLHTDGSQRFERGVDPEGQQRALARASELLRRLCGAQCGPILEAQIAAALPAHKPIELRAQKLQRLLGVEVPAAEVTRLLRALGLKVQTTHQGWSAQAPSWRFDLAGEVDLVEEVVRLRGLDSVPEVPAAMDFALRPAPETEATETAVLQLLIARGYHEVITFGFVDPALQSQLFPGQDAVALANPIASNLAVMRSSLWPGLLGVALENQRRQRPRLRIVEVGSRFIAAGSESGYEQRMISGLVMGSRHPEQWGAGREGADFFDCKADVEALLALSGALDEFGFEPQNELGCLHPGRSARILRAGRFVGVMGELHPELTRALDLTYSPILFELDYEGATAGRLAKFHELSRFPQVRRDISFTVDAGVSFNALRDRVRVAASTRLREITVFDVYQGEGVESGRKSIALGLILQDFDRTLTDEDADRVVAGVVAELRAGFDARIRE